MSAQLVSSAEKAALRRIFQELIVHKQCQNIQKLTLQHSPFGNFKVIPYFVESPLCSASLLTSQIVHYVVRNFIPPQKSAVKDVMHLTYEKNPNWNFVKDQSQIFSCLLEHQQRLQTQLDTAQSLLRSFPNDSRLRAHVSELSDALDGTTAVLRAMEKDKVHLNAFPQSGIENNKIRGMMLQLKGANRGARAERTKKLIGATETHSEGMRIFESAKQTWLSKVGTFGIKLTVVYGNTPEYVNKNFQLRNGSKPYCVEPKEWAIE